MHSGRRGTLEPRHLYSRIHTVPGTTNQLGRHGKLRRGSGQVCTSTESMTSFLLFSTVLWGLQTSEGTNMIWSLPPYQSVFIGHWFASSVFINKTSHHCHSGISPWAYLEACLVTACSRDEGQGRRTKWSGPRGNNTVGSRECWGLSVCLSLKLLWKQSPIFWILTLKTHNTSFHVVKLQ